MEGKKPIVEIKNLFKCYHRESLVVLVLHDITFDIADGEFLALMGFRFRQDDASEPDRWY